MATHASDPAKDSESRVAEIIAILTVASVLSTLTVGLRCYCRAFMLRSFGWDDGVLLPAQVLTLGSALAIGLETKYGLGRHYWVMPDEDHIPYMKSFYSSIIIYNVAVCMTKISILLQYRRIFNNTMLHKIILFGLGFLICWGITLCFLLPLVCVPTAAFWDKSVDGHCLDNQTIWYIMAGVNVVTDFALFTMPIPVISSLHLPKRQKALLLIVFTLGIFPCAVSIYRIRTLHAAASSEDPTWENIDAATFSFLELTVGVIAICLPTLRPVLMAAMPRIFGSILRSASGGHAGYNNHNGPYGAGTGGRGGTTGGQGGTVLTGRGTITGTTTKGGGSLAGSGGGGTLTRKKSLLHRDGSSDSTEGLHLPPYRPRSGTPSIGRGDEQLSDIEFGDLESASGGLSQEHDHPIHHGPGRGKYSVSVVADGGGWERDRVEKQRQRQQNQENDQQGIKTTITVSQKVTFAKDEVGDQGGGGGGKS